MDRKAIKEEAKAMVKGNKWNVWKPVFVVALIEFVVSFVIGLICGFAKMDQATISIVNAIVSVILTFAILPVTVGIDAYYLEIVRGKKPELKDFLTKYYNQFGKIFLMSLVASILVCLASCLFVIPGIILSLAYNFMILVLVDNPKLGWKEVLTKSREMMKGHKGELFVFFLSFIGWIILAEMTLGILFIWLLPYMVLAETLWYDKLSKLK